MKQIVVIGGGFGGLAALQQIMRSEPGSAVTLIDKKDTFDFLPLLPDSIGRGIDPRFLIASLNELSLREGFRFINEEVLEVDFKKKEIRTSRQNVLFDYLVIASGSETNFYGNKVFRRQANSLDSVKDATLIVTQLKRKVFSNIIVCGGGYTGIEAATNAKIFAMKNAHTTQVIIVERAPSIVGPLPEWMKRYVKRNLDDLGIEVCVDCAITSIEEDKVSLSSGRSFLNAFVIWAAGVKTADFIQATEFQKNQQGRLFVDDCLRLNETSFAIGDAACVRYGDGILRMGVQFAVAQGLLAGHNIVSLMKGLTLKKYKPIDFGYIVPMANDRACGSVLGLNVSGRLATIFHYCMCAYRSYGLFNKVGVLTKLNVG